MAFARISLSIDGVNNLCALSIQDWNDDRNRNKTSTTHERDTYALHWLGPPGDTNQKLTNWKKYMSNWIVPMHLTGKACDTNAWRTMSHRRFLYTWSLGTWKIQGSRRFSTQNRYLYAYNIKQLQIIYWKRKQNEWRCSTLQHIHTGKKDDKRHTVKKCVCVCWIKTKSKLKYRRSIRYVFIFLAYQFHIRGPDRVCLCDWSHHSMKADSSITHIFNAVHILSARQMEYTQFSEYIANWNE